MIIGKWQPITSEEKKEIEDKIKKGHNILICIENVDVTEEKPMSAEQIEVELKKIFWKHLTDEKIKTLIIPEIE